LPGGGGGGGGGAFPVLFCRFLKTTAVTATIGIIMATITA